MSLPHPDIAFGYASHPFHFVIVFHLLRSSLCAGERGVKATGRPQCWVHVGAWVRKV